MYIYIYMYRLPTTELICSNSHSGAAALSARMIFLCCSFASAAQRARRPQFCPQMYFVVSTQRAHNRSNDLTQKNKDSFQCLYYTNAAAAVQTIVVVINTISGPDRRPIPTRPFAQIWGADASQTYPYSTAHTSEHPSPETVLPSSHSSLYVL